MKYLVFLLVLLPVVVFAQVDTAETKQIFTGVKYDDGTFYSVGFGYNLSNNIWLIQYNDFGEYQSFDSEIAYLFNIDAITSKLSFGPIAGPNVDRVDAVDPEENVTYLVGSSGAIVKYDISKNMGVFGLFKYKYSVDKEDNFENTYVYGMNFYYGF